MVLPACTKSHHRRLNPLLLKGQSFLPEAARRLPLSQQALASAPRIIVISKCLNTAKSCSRTAADCSRTNFVASCSHILIVVLLLAFVVERTLPENNLSTDFLIKPVRPVSWSSRNRTRRRHPSRRTQVF